MLFLSKLRPVVAFGLFFSVFLSVMVLSSDRLIASTLEGISLV